MNRMNRKSKIKIERVLMAAALMGYVVVHGSCAMNKECQKSKEKAYTYEKDFEGFCLLPTQNMYINENNQ